MADTTMRTYTTRLNAAFKQGCDGASSGVDILPQLNTFFKLKINKHRLQKKKQSEEAQVGALGKASGGGQRAGEEAGKVATRSAK